MKENRVCPHQGEVKTVALLLGKWYFWKKTARVQSPGGFGVSVGVVRDEFPE